MTPVKQITDFSCGLACIESSCRDHGINFNQAAFFRSFPEILKKGDYHSIFIPSFAFSAGLANCFHLSKGKEYILANLKHIHDVSVYICTQTDGKGGIWGHCWRLESSNEEGFRVMEPSRSIAEEFQFHPWEDLTKYDCLVHVLGHGEIRTGATGVTGPSR